MNPTVFRYCNKGGAALYVSPLSAFDALSMFDQRLPISVASFGATCYKNCGWATEKDLPRLERVDELRALLANDIGLMELSVTLGSGTTLAIADDTDCEFVFPDRKELATAIERLVSPQASQRLMAALFRHVGAFFQCVDGLRVQQCVAPAAYLNHFGRRSP